MIVNIRCNISTLDKVEFWESSMINTDVKYTNVKLMEYVNNTDNTDHVDNTNQGFKKRLKLNRNKYKRLEYNNIKNNENIKKNLRDSR
jgi:hypothetical protein